MYVNPRPREASLNLAASWRYLFQEIRKNPFSLGSEKSALICVACNSAA